MKKIYLTLAAAAFMGTANAQFWTYTSYKGAFPITDGTSGTTSNDWTAGWCNWNPVLTAYGSPTITVGSDITANTTWTTGTIVLLQNKVYVKSGATLTIQPGVIIRGEESSQGTLIITKGSKIMAMGTQANPIVFTSELPNDGSRAEGNWGGLVILGQALNNQPGGVANIEGITASTDTEYGGTNDADNSGELHYVRIEFAGIALAPNKEINGLTLGSVGSGTTIDHVQVSFCGDDGFEWFGGTVDAKYLVSFRNLDDDFDCDFGFRGRVQFALSVKDKDLSDAAGDSNAFECDNDAAGSNALPRTMPVFSNVTIIGPKGNGSTALPVGEKFEKSFRLRRNSAVSIHNSLSTGWEKGLSIEGSAAEDNYNGGTIDSAYFKNNILSNYTVNTAKVTASASFYSAFFTADGNDTLTTIAGINWVNAFPATLETTGDYRLNLATTATGAVFTGPNFTGGFVGIENAETNELSDLAIYPNPANEQLNIAFNVIENTNAVVSILDVAGKVIYTTTLNATGGINKHLVNVAGFNNGVYFVRVNAGELSSTIKFIKN
ncbi:MAG TPA: T9SS type A sorting domain-containing protein [Flavobacteriales bacterium]|nr:T9SS type A sorting domain-containing protein [Flavobacteriales bacterium]